MTLLDKLPARNVRTSQDADKNFKRLSELLSAIKLEGSRSDPEAALATLIEGLSEALGIEDNTTS